MSDISEWSDVEAENTHIDELTLSGENGQYINKMMCAIKKKTNSIDDIISEVDPSLGERLVHKTGNETLGGVKTFEDSPLVPVPSDEASQQAAPAIWVRDTMRAHIEAMTGGRNTVVYDRYGQPHVMVVVPKFLLSDIDASWASSPHPAFIVNGVAKPEILIGKYQAGKSTGNHALTMPRKAPWVEITFDNSLAACRDLGTGFCLVTNAMWSARALWDYTALGGSHAYLGNRNHGRDYTYHELTGVMKSGTYTPGNTGTVDAATLTGSGGPKWNDDETDSGISDFTGNVWERVAGLRLYDGEIQIIPNNDASLSTCDMTASSTEWKAILEDGTLVAPGTADTLKYDGSAADTKASWSDAGTFRLNTELVNQNDKAYYSVDFKSLDEISGVTAPAILKQLALSPVGDSHQGKAWVCNKTERIPARGGAWHDGGDCGPFALDLKDVRTLSYRSFGFRVAFVAS